MLLAEGWEIKEMKELPWNYCSFSGKKNVFYIKGIENFSFKDGNKINQIKRSLIWSKNDLIIDTGEDFYYSCSLLPMNLIERIKKHEVLDIAIENVYNKNTEVTKFVFYANFK